MKSFMKIIAFGLTIVMCGCGFDPASIPLQTAGLQANVDSQAAAVSEMVEELNLQIEITHKISKTHYECGNENYNRGRVIALTSNQISAQLKDRRDQVWAGAWDTLNKYSDALKNISAVYQIKADAVNAFNSAAQTNVKNINNSALAGDAIAGVADLAIVLNRAYADVEVQQYVEQSYDGLVLAVVALKQEYPKVDNYAQTIFDRLELCLQDQINYINDPKTNNGVVAPSTGVELAEWAYQSYTKRDNWRTRISRKAGLDALDAVVVEAYKLKTTAAAPASFCDFFYAAIKASSLGVADYTAVNKSVPVAANDANAVLQSASPTACASAISGYNTLFQIKPLPNIMIDAKNLENEVIQANSKEARKRGIREVPTHHKAVPA